MLATPLFPSILDIVFQCHLLDVKLWASSSTFLSSGPFVWVPPLSISRMAQVSYKEDCPGVFFNEISAAENWFQVFLFIWDTLFLFFLSSLLVWWCPLPIFSHICDFLYLQTFRFSLFDRSISLIIYLFPLFIMSIAHFLMPNSIPISRLYILIVLSEYLLFLFCKQLDVVNPTSFLTTFKWLFFKVFWVIESLPMPTGLF